MNYDDAFTLEPVKQQLLDNFNYVAGIAPILTTHIKKVHTVINNASQVHVHFFSMVMSIMFLSLILKGHNIWNQH